MSGELPPPGQQARETMSAVSGERGLRPLLRAPSFTAHGTLHTSARRSWVRELVAAATSAWTATRRVRVAHHALAHATCCWRWAMGCIQARHALPSTNLCKDAVSCAVRSLCDRRKLGNCRGGCGQEQREACCWYPAKQCVIVCVDQPLELQAARYTLLVHARQPKLITDTPTKYPAPKCPAPQLLQWPTGPHLGKRSKHASLPAGSSQRAHAACQGPSPGHNPPSAQGPCAEDGAPVPVRCHRPGTQL